MRVSSVDAKRNAQGQERAQERIGLGRGPGEITGRRGKSWPRSRARSGATGPRAGPREAALCLGLLSTTRVTVSSLNVFRIWCRALAGIVISPSDLMSIPSVGGSGARS